MDSSLPPGDFDKVIGHEKTLSKSEKITNKKFDAFTFLKNLKEFSDLTMTQIKTLTEHSRLSTYNPGQYVSIEGDDTSDYGFIVVTGCIAMTKTSSSGKELYVELLQSGDLFGMLLTLAKDKLVAQLSARTLQNTTVLWVSLNDFAKVVKSSNIMLAEVIAHLLVCLQSSYRLSRGLAHDHVHIRIAAILTSLAKKFALKEVGERSLTVKFTRQQLADLTGTTPETAIRVTRAMQKDKIIDIKKPGVIKILKIDALCDLLDN